MLRVRRGGRATDPSKKPVRHLTAFLPPRTDLFEPDGGHQPLKMFWGHVPRVEDARQRKLECGVLSHLVTMRVRRWTYRHEEQAIRAQHSMGESEHAALGRYE